METLEKERQFIQIPELAERLGCSAEHLYRLARNGKLPGCIPLGRRYVVNVDVFLARQG
jgi:excisionase family DNA binding protein